MTKFKVYTKSGDKGKTSLATGERVPKSDLRIECYGTIDELNALVGMLRDTLPKNQIFSESASILLWVQNLLFDIGAEVSSNSESISRIALNRFNNDHVNSLEKHIDKISEELPPLKNFVLPGGHFAASQTHLLRTVCRRAERLLVRYNSMPDTDSISENILIFMNRLSDYFFVLSRFIVIMTNNEEITWTKLN